MRARGMDRVCAQGVVPAHPRERFVCVWSVGGLRRSERFDTLLSAELFASTRLCESTVDGVGIWAVFDG